MLKMLFIDGFLWRNGAVGFFMSSVLTGIILLISVYMIDNIGVEPAISSGTVLSSEFVPEHWTTSTSTTTINGITTTTSTPVHHPDAWYLTIQVKGGAGKLEVSYDNFNKYSTGSHVMVSYIHGRLTGGLYIRSLVTD